MNPQRKKLLAQEWRDNHPGYRSAEMKAWRQKNKDKVQTYRQTETYRAARQRYFYRRLQIEGSHTTQEWIDLKKIYGNVCVKCGEKEYAGNALTIDHKVPVSKGGTNNIDNLQPLCKRCNSSKGATTWFAQCPLKFS